MTDIKQTFRAIVHERGVAALFSAIVGFGIFVLHPLWVGLVVMMLVGFAIVAALIGSFRLVSLVPIVLVILLFPSIEKAVLWLASLVGVVALTIALGKTMDFAFVYRKRIDLKAPRPLWLSEKDYVTAITEGKWLARVLLAAMIDLAALIPLYGFTFLLPDASQAVAPELLAGFCLFATTSALSLVCLSILMARHPNGLSRDRSTWLLFGLTLTVLVTFAILPWVGIAEESPWLRISLVNVNGILKTISAPLPHLLNAVRHTLPSAP